MSKQSFTPDDSTSPQSLTERPSTHNAPPPERHFRFRQRHRARRQGPPFPASRAAAWARSALPPPPPCEESRGRRHHAGVLPAARECPEAGERSVRAAAPTPRSFAPAPLNAPRAAARAGPRIPSPPPPAPRCDASASAAPAPRRGRPRAPRRRPAARSGAGPAAAWRREARGGPGGREERARLRLPAPAGPPRAEAQGRPRAEEGGGGAGACGGRRGVRRRAAATLRTAARAQRCVRRGLARFWGMKPVWAQALFLAVGCALSNPTPRWCPRWERWWLNAFSAAQAGLPLD